MIGSLQLWHMSRRVFAVLLMLFILLPLIVVLLTSFTAESFVRFPPSSYGVRWWEAVFRNSSFRNALLFSLEIAALVAVISATLGVASALVLARERFLGRETIVAVLMMPLAVPHIVLAIAILQLCGRIGIASSPYGLVAGHVLITLPFVLRLTMASLIGLDRQIELASFSLGASGWQTLRRITLPMVAPGLVAGVVFAFLMSFDESTISLFTSVPGRTTLPAEIFGYASQGSDPLVTAGSGLMIVMAIVIVFLAERFLGILRLITNEPVAKAA